MLLLSFIEDVSFRVLLSYAHEGRILLEAATGEVCGDADRGGRSSARETRQVVVENDAVTPQPLAPGFQVPPVSGR